MTIKIQCRLQTSSWKSWRAPWGVAFFLHYRGFPRQRIFFLLFCREYSRQEKKRINEKNLSNEIVLPRISSSEQILNLDLVFFLDVCLYLFNEESLGSNNVVTRFSSLKKNIPVRFSQFLGEEPLNGGVLGGRGCLRGYGE